MNRWAIPASARTHCRAPDGARLIGHLRRARRRTFGSSSAAQLHRGVRAVADNVRSRTRSLRNVHDSTWPMCVAQPPALGFGTWWSVVGGRWLEDAGGSSVRARLHGLRMRQRFRARTWHSHIPAFAPGRPLIWRSCFVHVPCFWRNRSRALGRSPCPQYLGHVLFADGACGKRIELGGKRNGGALACSERPGKREPYLPVHAASTEPAMRADISARTDGGPSAHKALNMTPMKWYYQEGKDETT